MSSRRRPSLTREQLLAQFPRAKLRWRRAGATVAVVLTVACVAALALGREAAEAVDRSLDTGLVRLPWPASWQRWIGPTQRTLRTFPLGPRLRVDTLTAIVVALALFSLLLCCVSLCRAQADAAEAIRERSVVLGTDSSDRTWFGWFSWFAPPRRRSAPVFKAPQPVELVYDYAITSAAAQLLRQAGRAVIEGASTDEDMPAWISQRARRVLEWLWLELESEVLDTYVYDSTYASRAVRYEEIVSLDRRSRPLEWCPNPFRKLRASILYTLYPCDRSFWGQLRMPLYYPLMAAFLTPAYGISPICFLLLFLLRDKSDEFQLCQFILEFRGFQFLTSGVIAAVIGGLQLQHCATRGSCAERGVNGAPGMNGPFVFENCCFILNVALIYAAFLLLPFSERKGAVGDRLGRIRERAEQRQQRSLDRELERGRIYGRERSDGERPLPSQQQQQQQQGGGTPRRTPPCGVETRLGGGRTSSSERAQLRRPSAQLAGGSPPPPAPWWLPCFRGRVWNTRRGGALRPFIAYDATCFVLVALLAAYGWLTNEGWERASWIFWCRVVYGLCALPFLVFMVPPVDQILLHVKRTTFDQRGRCVAPLSMADRQVLRKLQLGKLATQLSLDASDIESTAGAFGPPTARPSQRRRMPSIRWPVRKGSLASARGAAASEAAVR